MKLILSTSNIIGSGPTVIRRPAQAQSNTELITSLRANFLAHQQSASSTTTSSANSTSSSIPSSAPPSLQSWTSQKEKSLYIPAPDPTPTSALQEDRSAYDITLKLFYLPQSRPEDREAQTRDALEHCIKELQVDNVDLLIASFPSILFSADDEDEDSDSEPMSEESSSAILPESQTDGKHDGIPVGSSGPESGINVETLPSMLRTWETLEALHEEGRINQLGVSEFGTARLSRFLSNVNTRPSVDQINVRDCCVVPKPLILYAKKEKIELLTHNDCTNILPRGTLRELLGPAGKGGAGVLAGREGDAMSSVGRNDDCLKGDVSPLWVVKYTAVVRDRGVVESKGYFACAELREE